MSVKNVSDGKTVNPIIQARIDFALKYLGDGCGINTEQMTAIQNILGIVPPQAPTQMTERNVVVNSLKRPREDDSKSPILIKRQKKSPVVSIEQHGPFLAIETFHYVSKYLQKAQIGRLARTCQLWNNFCQDSWIWKQMTINEGIPLLEGKKERDYRAYLKLLCPITISGKMIEACLGEVVGAIPPLSKRWFHNLSKPSCYFSGNFSNIVRTGLVVVPGFVKRRFSIKEFSYSVNNEGFLRRGVYLDEGQEVIIPMNRYNVDILAANPLKKKNLLLVCRYLSSSPDFNYRNGQIIPKNKLDLFLIPAFPTPTSDPVAWAIDDDDYDCASSHPVSTFISDMNEEESSDERYVYCEETSLSSDEESNESGGIVQFADNFVIR